MHTFGSLLKWVPILHATVSMHEQIPEQSAPPALGSQPSSSGPLYLVHKDE
ncbi:MAG: hypothetical protein ABI488_17485 [Polyangiaceae bacterium]